MKRAPSILSHSSEPPCTLKGAQRSLIDSTGGVEGAAEYCRIEKSRISDCGNKNKPNAHLAVDVVKTLEKVGGIPYVTMHLAAAHGCVLVQVDPGRRDPDWRKNVDKLTKECCEAISKATDAVRDGTVNNGEATALISELDEAAYAVMALRQLCVDLVIDRMEAAE